MSVQNIMSKAICDSLNSQMHMQGMEVSNPSPSKEVQPPVSITFFWTVIIRNPDKHAEITKCVLALDYL